MPQWRSGASKVLVMVHVCGARQPARAACVLATRDAECRLLRNDSNSPLYLRRASSAYGRCLCNEPICTWRCASAATHGRGWPLPSYEATQRWRRVRLTVPREARAVNAAVGTGADLSEPEAHETSCRHTKGVRAPAVRDLAPKHALQLHVTIAQPWSAAAAIWWF